MNYDTEYWFLSEEDYANLTSEAALAGYDLSDFGQAYHTTREGYAGWYFDFGEIDPEEMEWMEATFPSFDLRVVNLSVQAWFAPTIP